MRGEDLVMNTYNVAVRTLCEFGARTGSLDYRAGPSPSAQEGISGHQAVVAARSSDYRAELKLEATYQGLGSQHLAGLLVRGRADGYEPHARRLEEIKTYRGELSTIKPGQQVLHWAQLRIYGHLFCLTQDKPAPELALVYYNVDTAEETVLTANDTAFELQIFFDTVCEQFLAWAISEQAHRDARNHSLQSLKFPFDEFRSGQRALAAAVYNAHRRRCALLAQAPTGIGKSLATLYPALKAGANQAVDKIFFLTAKTPGRQVALDAWQRIRLANPGVSLRVLELVARDKACEYPDRACHGDSCPLAKGFYDRLAAARQAAIVAPILDRPTVRHLALANQICPYYFAQEMVKWSDVVVGDYNHYFSANAVLQSLTVSNDWVVSVLVDEAHNLIDRARQMYSVGLQQNQFDSTVPTTPTAVQQALDRVAQVFADLAGQYRAPYQVLDVVPEPLLAALKELCLEMGRFLASAQAGQTLLPESALMQQFFSALRFCRLAESFGEHSLCDLTHASAPEHGNASVSIRNILPAPFLRPNVELAHAMVFFSATLTPRSYLCDMLGLPDSTVFADIPAPFSAEQLDLHLVDTVSTRWRNRDTSIEPISELIGSQYQQRPGNYLVFASSFDYISRIAGQFKQDYPTIKVCEQSRAMGEPERDLFLGQFTDDSQQVGFAVLGGVFAEGVDLPGDRLIGAFVVTLGLAQINPVTEAIKKRTDAVCGSGYEYTYLYPGLHRVIQAAGRVIRTPSDRGALYLIDDRIADPRIQRLLPQWWLARPQLEREPVAEAKTTASTMLPDPL